jgi:arsenite methyltransferase
MTPRLSNQRQSAHALCSLALLLALGLASCTTLKRCAYEGINRNEWQKPEEVIRALTIQPGAKIADLGSGGGYFTFRLADAVGQGGKVFAVDIDEEMNRYIRDRAMAEARKNIEVILAKPDDPLLPESGVDLIFTVNTYHHIEERAKYFANAVKYLRPGGRLAIIDFNGKGWIESFGGHYTPSPVIKEEMEKAGYRPEREFDFLPRQYFLVFTRNPS